MDRFELLDGARDTPPGSGGRENRRFQAHHGERERERVCVCVRVSVWVGGFERESVGVGVGVGERECV